MFAVIRTGGKQYRVAEGDEIVVERLTGDEGDVIQLGEVLMLGGETANLGAPTVAGASVAAEIVEQGRGEKITIFKKKRRQNYRRKKGHRQLQTTLRISEILTDGATPKKAAAKPKTAAPKPAPASSADAPAPSADIGTAPQLFDGAPENADDLTKIAGVGPKLSGLMNELGIYTYEQIAGWTPEHIAWVDERLKFKGRIERDDWVSKARELADAKNAE